MLTLKSLNADKSLSVFLAIDFAEKALPIWEAEHPSDMRPRRAIEAAKAWLSNPDKDAAADAAADAATDAAYDAAYDAASAASAAYAAAAAASAAASAASAAASRSAAYAAVFRSAAADAAAAASAASRALSADKKSLIHEVILENLDWILQYKIENGESFAEPELILNYLDKEQWQSFLFNLDAVV